VKCVSNCLTYSILGPPHDSPRTAICMKQQHRYLLGAAPWPNNWGSPIIISNLLSDLITGILNTVSCHETGIQSKRTHNKFKYCTCLCPLHKPAICTGLSKPPCEMTVYIMKTCLCVCGNHNRLWCSEKIIQFV